MTECNATNWRQVVEEQCGIPADGWEEVKPGAWQSSPLRALAIWRVETYSRTTLVDVSRLEGPQDLSDTASTWGDVPGVVSALDSAAELIDAYKHGGSYELHSGKPCVSGATPKTKASQDSANAPETPETLWTNTTGAPVRFVSLDGWTLEQPKRFTALYTTATEPVEHCLDITNPDYPKIDRVTVNGVDFVKKADHVNRGELAVWLDALAGTTPDTSPGLPDGWLEGARSAYRYAAEAMRSSTEEGS